MILNKKIKSSLLVGLFFLTQSINAQTAVFTVTSPLQAYLPGHFEYEWAQALNFLSVSATAQATLQLDANNPLNVPDGHLVQLTKNHTQASLLDNNRLVIKEKDNAIIRGQGFEMMHFALPVTSTACANGWCWTAPLYGFSIVGLGNLNNGSNQAQVIFKNVRFVNFNKTWNSIIEPNFLILNQLPGFFPTWYNPCGGGPPCILTSNVFSLTVEGCKFENYSLAIHYAKIKEVLFDGNVFSSDGYYGGSCPSGAGVGDGILFKDFVKQNYTVKTEIKNNVFTASPSTLDYPGTGIIINPCNWPFGPNSSTNFSTRVDFNIHNNQIKNCLSGIIQYPSNPNRTTEDPLYKMDIQNNTFENGKLNLGLGAPYRSFIVNNNIFNLKNTKPNPINPGTPAFLGLGSYSWVPVGNSIVPVRPQLPNNAYGFKMIYTPNTLNQPAFNNQNTFNYINNPMYTGDPMIYTIGDFKKQVDLIGPISFNGFFEIGSGKNTNIRETKNTFNGIEIGNPPFNTNIVFANPIVHTNNLATLPLTSIPYALDPSNGNLQAPTLKSAQVDNNKLKIAFDLTGSAIIAANGPYIVEFYRSNLKGELIDFLGKQTINTLTNATYSLTVIPPANLTPPFKQCG